MVQTVVHNLPMVQTVFHQPIVQTEVHNLPMVQTNPPTYGADRGPPSYLWYRLRSTYVPMVQPVVHLHMVQTEIHLPMVQTEIHLPIADGGPQAIIESNVSANEAPSLRPVQTPQATHISAMPTPGRASVGYL